MIGIGALPDTAREPGCGLSDRLLAIDESGPALQKYFGFSPGNAEWEAYAQSRQGAAMVLRLPDDVSADDVRGRLASAGFKRPASDGGVWRGGADLVSTLDPSISPELQYVVVLDHLVVSSDSASYARKAAAVASGDGAALAGVDGVDTLSGGVEQPASATALVLPNIDSYTTRLRFTTSFLPSGPGRAGCARVDDPSEPGVSAGRAPRRPGRCSAAAPRG